MAFLFYFSHHNRSGIKLKTTNTKTYGALYDRDAETESHIIGPGGWHFATDAGWIILVY